MLSNMLKKIIIFFIPFFIINNIYAAEGLTLTYRYQANDKTYVVTIKVPSVDKIKAGTACEEITISEGSNSTVGIGTPTDVKSFDDIFLEFGNYGGFFTSYGVTDFNISLIRFDIDLSGDKQGRGLIFDELKKNPEKYAPILKFDNNGEPILMGSYIADAYNETSDKSNNLNDYLSDDPEFIDKFLGGKITRKKINDLFLNGIKVVDLYEKMNINTSISATLIASDVSSTNSGNKKPVNRKDEESANVNYNGGSCDSKRFILKNMWEQITNGGICSEKSLKAMKSTQSLYDLEVNFDHSVLEPECESFVFGSEGYINEIIFSQALFNSIPDDDISKRQLSCLGMQSEYLKGISTLTVYEQIVKVDKSECELINSETLDFLNSLFDAIKLIATCICIFLCVTDVYKIVITKESDVTKFRKVLVKRVVALVFLFLTPIIVNIITDLLNERYLQSNPIKCADILNSR